MDSSQDSEDDEQDEGGESRRRKMSPAGRDSLLETETSRSADEAPQAPKTSDETPTAPRTNLPTSLMKTKNIAGRRAD
jgi:hypothetical protein